MSDFTWFDRLVHGIHTLRVVFARELSWQDMLVVGFNLDPMTATTETLGEQEWHEDSSVTIRTGSHLGWGYAVQTVLELTDDEDQLGRLSHVGEAFVLAFTETIEWFGYATAGAFVSGFDMVLPQARPPHPRFASQMAEAGFLEHLPNPRIVGPRFVELAFGVTLTPALVEGPLSSVVR